MPLANGTNLGPYEIVAPIGAGGMGEVYRARDTRLGREVAVKVLPESFAIDADRLHRFEQEARAVAALNHANILALYDIGVHDDIHYIVTELLEGETLRALMASGTLSTRKAVEYALHMAHGIAAAHDRNITHRDLKPDNVFVTSDGHVKILDFGLAKPQTVATDAVNTIDTIDTRTTPGTVLGTVGYMSPEQVRGQSAGHRSDIFSFGAMLYEMLSGNQAFKRESSVETMNAILKEDPPELMRSGLAVSPSLERIVRRCLEKKPGERFQSARDLAFALDALSGTSSSQTGITPVAPRAIRRWLIAGMAAVVLLAAGVLLGRQSVPARTLPKYQALTIRPGTIYSANFAPDGQTVLFSAAFDGGQPDVYVSRRESVEPHALGLAPAILLAISKKNDMAVIVNAHFVAHLQWEGTLATAHIGAGAPREMLEHVLDADYGPDGETMAVVREVNGKIRLEYPPGKLLYETTGWVSGVRVSPDGQRLAFLDHTFLWDDRGSVAVVDLQGRKQILSEGWSGLEGLAWSPSGDEVWFGGSVPAGTRNRVGPTQNTYAVTMSGKERLALVGPEGLTVWDFDRDGRILAASGSEEHGIIFSRTGQPERDLGWLQDSIGPFLSADGKVMLFHDSTVGPYYTTCIRKTDGSPVTQLGPGAAGALTPDGRWAFAMVYSDPPELRLIPTGPGEVIALQRGPLASYELGDWMPDGKSVLFTGNEAGKRVRAYVQSITGGPPKAVTPEGVDVCPRGISPDGKWVTAIDAQHKIVLYPLSGGESVAVPGVEPGEAPIRFNTDGTALYVARSGEYPVPVYKVDVKSGQRQLLRKIMPVDGSGLTPQRVDRGFIHATPDGTAFAYTYGRWRGNLYLVAQGQ
jgi:WD40 repeat protein